MDITLTIAEQEMMEGLAIPGETVDIVFHRLLRPHLESYGEARLQILANQYRKLSPDLQSEALQVLKEWQLSKLRPPAEPTPQEGI